MKQFITGLEYGDDGDSTGYIAEGKGEGAAHVFGAPNHFDSDRRQYVHSTVRTGH